MGLFAGLPHAYYTWPGVITDQGLYSQRMLFW